jgi:pSer/pThr/pTyr-binding forkhead associated (FHA) protein
VRTDGAPGPVYPLEGAEVVCGRTEGEIRIADDGTVSPRHARFTLDGDRLTVEDLGTVNGTFLRIRAPERVALGEEIRVGRQLLRVEPLLRPPEAADGTRAWGAPDPGCRLRLAQLLDGGGLGEVHPLREGENVIGREAGEVVFPGDRYVSARHAQLDVEGDALTLSDLGSSNGTFRRIAGPTVIAPGDQLLIGAQLLKLEA